MEKFRHLFPDLVRAEIPLPDAAPKEHFARFQVILGDERVYVNSVWRSQVRQRALSSFAILAQLHRTPFYFFVNTCALGLRSQSLTFRGMYFDLQLFSPTLSRTLNA